MKPYKRIVNNKRSDCYYVQYTFKGKQIQKSTRCKVKADAERWIKENINPLVNHDNVKGLVQTIKRMSVSGEKILMTEAFNKFLLIPRKKSMCKQHETNKRSMWNDFTAYAREKGSIKFIHQLDTKVCNDYITHTRTSGRYIKRHKSHIGKDQQLSSKTKNDFLKALKQVCNAFFKDGGIIENPFKDIYPLDTDEESREAFTRDDLQLIGQKYQGDIEAIFKFGLFTGFRKKDICLLKWNDIDLDNLWIKVKTEKTGFNVRLPIMTPLHDYLLTLEKHSDSVYVNPELARLYLTGKTGESTITRRFKAFLNRLNIKNQKKVKGRDKLVSTKDIHSLRHTFVWLAAEQNIPLPIIQSCVGHMTEKMTRIYADHATDRAKKDQLNIPNYFEPDSKKRNVSDADKLLNIRKILSKSISSPQKVALIKQAL